MKNVASLIFFLLTLKAVIAPSLSPPVRPSSFYFFFVFGKWGRQKGKVDKVQPGLGQGRLYYARSKQTEVKEEVCEAFELGKYKALRGFHCD